MISSGTKYFLSCRYLFFRLYLFFRVYLLFRLVLQCCERCSAFLIVCGANTRTCAISAITMAMVSSSLAPFTAAAHGKARLPRR